MIAPVVVERPPAGAHSNFGCRRLPIPIHVDSVANPAGNSCLRWLTFKKAGTIKVTFDAGSMGFAGPRLIIASTETVVPAPAAPPPSPGDFFTHLCGTRVMANVTVSPGRERAGQRPGRP